jgi:L1 cell adhesion molecule like protein
MAETEEFAHKQKELESICNPIITKLYQQSGGVPNPGAGSCGQQSGHSYSAGPTVEEVD